MTKHDRLIRSLTHQWRAAARAEESAADLAASWRLAARTDAARRRLDAALAGIVPAAPRTRRNLAIGAFAALATIGKAIGKALAARAALIKAQAVNAARRAARALRASARRALRSIVLAAIALAPSIAAAHPGHDGHDEPFADAGGGVVLVGLTLGLAGYAWAQWGDRRRALASADSGRPIAGGPSPEPEPSAEPEPDRLYHLAHTDESHGTIPGHGPVPPMIARCTTCGEVPEGIADEGLRVCSCAPGAQPGCLVCCGLGLVPAVWPFGQEPDSRACRARAAWEHRMASLVRHEAHGDITAAAHLRTAYAYEDRAADLEREALAPYYTVRIPYVAPERATIWHPTEDTGPFSQLTRGAHATPAEARAWAQRELDGNPYTIARVTPIADGDDLVETVLVEAGRDPIPTRYTR